MNITTIIQGTISILSLLAAILAWIAKIRWSTEYSKAKEEIIKSKDAQIQVLETTIQKYKDFSPEIVMRLFETTKNASEEYIKVSDQELKAAQVEIERINIEKEEIQARGEKDNIELEKRNSFLKRERDNLAKELEIIKSNPYSVQAGTIISASGSSIAISNALHRDTADTIKDATVPLFLDEATREEFEKKYPQVYFVHFDS